MNKYEAVWVTSAKIRRRVGRRDSGVGRATGQLSPAQTDSRLVMSVALTAATAPAFPFRAPTQQPHSCLACAALVTGPGSVRLCPSLIWLFLPHASRLHQNTLYHHRIVRPSRDTYTQTHRRDQGTSLAPSYVAYTTKHVHCFYTGLVVAATTAKGGSRRGGGNEGGVCEG